MYSRYLLDVGCPPWRAFAAQARVRRTFGLHRWLNAQPAPVAEGGCCFLQVDRSGSQAG